jgi:hypothetical protein
VVVDPRVFAEVAGWSSLLKKQPQAVLVAVVAVAAECVFLAALDDESFQNAPFSVSLEESKSPGARHQKQLEWEVRGDAQKALELCLLYPQKRRRGQLGQEQTRGVEQIEPVAYQQK